MENNTGDWENARPFSLPDLIDTAEWQKIQDNLSAITEVTLRTVDAKGNPVTLPSREPRLCSELIKDTYHKNKVCGSCLPTFLGGTGVVNRNLSFTCHATLNNFIAPLHFKNKVLGYVIAGPVILVMRKPKEQYLHAAEELNIELDDFWSALVEIKVISFQGMQSLIELFKDIAEYPLKLSSRKRGDFDLSQVDKLLHVLLDVAFQVTGADIGSIMLLGPGNDELRIHTSRGIKDEIARGTRVRMGEGISGFAAQQKVSLLIDDETRNSRIQSRLNRPQISSSMILPITIQEKVAGVMNLGTLRTSSVRFTADNVKLTNKLIDLATSNFNT